MKSAKESFISSTFWTERIGNVAALAALKEMERLQSWKKITDFGVFIQKKWEEIAQKNLINIIQIFIISLNIYEKQLRYLEKLQCFVQLKPITMVLTEI